METREHIGLLIQNARLGSGKSQVALAKHLGVSRSSVIRLEAGRYGLTSDRLVEIARWLQVEPAELLPKRLPRGRRAG